MFAEKIFAIAHYADQVVLIVLLINEYHFNCDDL
jgi:hypothetical protein